MTLTLVRSATGESNASATSTSATFTGSTTSGNLLWCACGGDKTAGTWTGPSGFTALINNSGTQVSMWVGYKVSDGSETTLTVSRSTASTAGDKVWIGEYSSSQSGTWTIVGSATNPSDNSTVTVWSTGTTAATTDAGGALAFFAMDSGQSHTGASTYSDSFTQVLEHGTTGRGSISVAFKDGIASGSTVTCSETHTPTGDQKSGCVAVFEKISAATGPVARSLIFGQAVRRASTW